MLEWLRQNSAVAEQAAAGDLEKCTRAELEFARLKAQTRLAISKADQADGLTIPKVDAVSEWHRAAAIMESEYKAFLEPSAFATAQRRAKLRIANLFGDGMPQQSDPAGVY